MRASRASGKKRPAGRGRWSRHEGVLGEEPIRMDRVYPLLEDIKRQGQARGNYLGLLNVLIGRRIHHVDGTLISSGLTWRQLAAAFKYVHWDVEAVRELGLDPDRLPPREREQFWYYAINRARVDSKEAKEAGDRLAELLKAAGYIVGSGPGK